MKTFQVPYYNSAQFQDLMFCLHISMKSEGFLSHNYMTNTLPGFHLGPPSK